MHVATSLRREVVAVVQNVYLPLGRFFYGKEVIYMIASAERLGGLVLPKQESIRTAGEPILIFLPQSAGGAALKIHPSQNGEVRNDRWSVIGEPNGRGLKRSALDVRFHPITPVSQVKHGEQGRRIPKSERNLRIILDGKREGTRNVDTSKKYLPF